MSDNLVSLELVAGLSGRNEWVFMEGTPRAVLRIGSGEHCNWNVEGEGVAANHVMLMWDGRQLTAVGTGADVRIDGVPLKSSEVLVGCRIEFGSAAILVRASGAPVIAGHAEPVPSGAETNVAGAPAPAATHQVSQETLISTPMRPKTSTPMAPRTSTPTPPSEASPDFATVMSGPPSDMAKGAPRAAPASAPGDVRVTSEPPASFPAGPGQGSGEAYDPDATNYAPPTPAVTPGPAHQEPPPEPARFAEPPSPATDPRREPSTPGEATGVSGGTGATGSMPARTWVLVGVTFLAAVVVLFGDSFGGAPSGVAPGSDTQTDVPPAQPEADTRTPSGAASPGQEASEPTPPKPPSPDVAEGGKAQAGGEQAGARSRNTGEAAPSAVVPERPGPLQAVDACDPIARSRRKPQAPCPTEASIAADFVAAGRYADALPVYEYLAADTGDDAYATMVEVLRRKLGQGSEP